VYNKLYEHCEQNKLLTDRNSGFKRRDSTINRLVQLVHDIYKGLDNKQEVLLVFLDISKAFDRVWHPGLLHKLRQFGVEGSTYEWFNSYLTNRSQKVVIGGASSSPKPTNAGVPQGSILGPLLFLIFINDIVDDIENDMFLFADDTTLKRTYSNLFEAEISINRDLQKLVNWSNQWRVTFSPPKTVFMVVSKKRTPTRPQLKMNTTSLNQVVSHLYLGLTITSDLNWGEHIQRVTAKASRRIGILYRANRLPRSVKANYYITFVRPILEYGNVLFDNCTAREAQSLEQIQRRAALICTGAFKRTGSILLLKEIGWQQLNTRRTKAKLILLYKIINNLSPAYLKDLLPNLVRDATNHNLRHGNDFRIPRTRLTCTSSSFIPSTLRLWNTTDPGIKNSTSLSSLKHKLKHKKEFLVSVYSFHSGYVSRMHTQIRLGLSKLKGHLFTHNIIDDPNCINCDHQIIENPCHYFLQCEAYAAPRRDMLQSLAQNLPQAMFNQPNNLICNILTHGSNDLSFNKNVQIFAIVQKFIQNSHRFNVHA